jgi:hypothetical protein
MEKQQIETSDPELQIPSRFKYIPPTNDGNDPLLFIHHKVVINLKIYFRFFRQLFLFWPF